MNDFGFTIEQDVPQEIDDRAERMYDMIVPLIDNLMKNPEVETIKWPNREVKLQEFKEKLQDILNDR